MNNMEEGQVPEGNGYLGQYSTAAYLAAPAPAAPVNQVKFGPPAPPATVNSVLSAMATCTMNTMRECKSFLSEFKTDTILPARDAIQQITQGIMGAIHDSNLALRNFYNSTNSIAFDTVQQIVNKYDEIFGNKSPEQLQRELEVLLMLYIESLYPNIDMMDNEKLLELAGNMSGQQNVRIMIDQLFRIFFTKKMGKTAVSSVGLEGLPGDLAQTMTAVTNVSYVDEINDRLDNIDYNEFLFALFKSFFTNRNKPALQRGDDTFYFGKSMTPDEFNEDRIQPIYEDLDELNTIISESGVNNDRIKKFNSIIDDYYEELVSIANSGMANVPALYYLSTAPLPRGVRKVEIDKLIKVKLDRSKVRLIAPRNYENSIFKRFVDLDRDMKSRYPELKPAPAPAGAGAGAGFGGDKRKTRKHSKNHKKSKKSRRVKGVKRSTKKR